MPLFDVQQYASSEEKWFSYYISELEERGYILKATYQPYQITISEDVFVFAYHKCNKYNKMVDVKLINGMIYTPDWEILWDEKAHGIFYWKEGGVYSKGFYPYKKGFIHIPFFSVGNKSVVDIKGQVAGRSNNSAITFPIKQKALMKDGVFVQKIAVSLDSKSLFAKTFTPRQMIIDEVYRRDYKENKIGDSKLKFNPLLLEQWLRLHGGTSCE